MKYARWQVDVAGLVACVALSGAAVAGGVWPMLDHQERRRQLRAELAASEAELADLESTLALAAERVAAVTDAMERSRLDLQPVGALNARIDELTRLATEAGVTVDEITPGAAASMPHVVSVAVRVGGRGSFAGCTAFLSGLARAFPDVRVETLRLAAAPAQPELGVALMADLTWFATGPCASAATLADQSR